MTVVIELTQREQRQLNLIEAKRLIGAARKEILYAVATPAEDDEARHDYRELERAVSALEGAATLVGTALEL